MASLALGTASPTFAAVATSPASGSEPANPTSTTEHGERRASGADSDSLRFSWIYESRYGDIIRKTDRLTYKDAGATTPVSCDITGDSLADMIFANRTGLHVLPYIPYGDPSDEVEISLSEQRNLLTTAAPAGENAFGNAVTCVSIKGAPHVAVAGERAVYLYSSDSAAPRLLAAIDPDADVLAIAGSPDSPFLAVGTADKVTIVDTARFETTPKPPAPPSDPPTGSNDDEWNEDGSEPPLGSGGELDPDVADLFDSDDSTPERSATETGAESDASAAGAGTADASAPGARRLLRDIASATWNVDTSKGLALLAFGSDLAVGTPATSTVAYAPASASSLDGAPRIVGASKQGASAEFGAAIARIGDINADGAPDLAVGAPGHNNEAGAFAVVQAGIDTVIDLDSTASAPVHASESAKRTGYLFRSPLYGRLGASLAWVDGGEYPGALFVGRPKDGEHPGALAISAKAFTQDFNAGQGILDLPGAHHATFVSAEGGESDPGAGLGIIPRRGDDPLQGVYTSDSKGRIDVWTVDMSRQGEKTHSDDEEIVAPIPEPQPRKEETSFVPLDTPTEKSWLGEFSSGLGGSLARGACDVTGDGRPDIISGNVVRSQWKWDPYYAESTPTRGWILNVTGEISIIPGGTAGQALPSAETISILGPRRTADPATDANIGFSVACLGDVNKDGVDDIAFGSHTMSRVWVVFGGSHLRDVDLNKLDPAHGWYVDLPSVGAGAFNITRVGDVNGDGMADVGFIVANAAVSADKNATPQGAAFILRGKADGAPVDMRDLTKNDPAVLQRIDSPEGNTFNSFTRVGDVNGDGTADYVVTDFQHMRDYVIPGKAWVVYGRAADATSDRSAAGARVRAGAPGAGFALTMPFDASHRLGAGTSVANVGAVTGDSIDDFVIGFDGGLLANQGTGGVALVAGEKAAIGQELDDVVISPKDPGATSARVRIITGPEGEKDHGFGYAVDALPIPGAGSAMLVVGAYGSTGNGRAWVFSTDEFASDPRGIADIKGTEIASRGERSRFGRAVAFIGDYLGKATVAIGGDGVIDDAATGDQGFAHSAHILARAVDLPDGAAPKPDGNARPGDSSTAQSSTTQTPSPGAEVAKGPGRGKADLARTGFTAGGMIPVALGCLAAGAVLMRRGAED